MVEGAAYLVDRALPVVPYRQWTLTLPWDLARRVAFDRSLCGAVFRIFVDCVQRWYEEQALRSGIASPQTGALLQIQRFADAAALGDASNCPALLPRCNCRKDSASQTGRTPLDPAACESEVHYHTLNGLGFSFFAPAARTLRDKTGMGASAAGKN